MKEIFWKNLEDGAVESAELVKFSQFLLSYSSIIETDSMTYTLMVYFTHQGVVREFEIKENEELIFIGRKNRNWWINGDSLSNSQNINFIDISLTPFTNTLPILFMKNNKIKKEAFPMLFIDVANHKFKIVQQQYTLMGDEVLYENLNSNYSNTLTIDQDNLTLDYPNVFTRLKKESAEN
ncbi:putative glycolipid-binding domain-containing protein [Vagococcus fluvialis]|uniref:putative glycolipid-binding domain-containing protein n=1 Tax=Vagococcus fluvialis TaxID=2738 RepID=UPI002FDA5A18